MPGFNYDGDSGSSFTGPSVTYGPNGEARINFSNSSPQKSTGGNSGGGAGNGNSNGTSNIKWEDVVNSARAGNIPAGYILQNGKIGYMAPKYKKMSTGHGESQQVSDGIQFVEVQDLTAAYNTGVKQRSEAAASAARAAADKARADSLAAAQQRQAAINAAKIAGQHLSVSQAQTSLNSATASVASLNTAANNARAAAVQSRSAANSANAAAVQAEQSYQDLLSRTTGKAPNGKNYTTKNGTFGYKEDITRETAEHTLNYTVWRSTGITVAQRDAARASAVNKRTTATQLATQAATAERASAAATKAAHNAETTRQAAQAALDSAQQAAVRAAEAERQRVAAESHAAEQQRLAKEAEKRAEEARVAAENIRVLQARQLAADKLYDPDIQSVRGIPATAAPAAFPLAWSVASSGGVTLEGEVAGSVWSRIAAALAELRGIATASLAGPVAVTIAALVWSEDVGENSDVVPGRDISTLMPGDAFSLPDSATLNGAADSNTGVSMPVRGRSVVRADESLETQLVRTAVAGNVPVVRAVLDKETGYWGYTLPAMPGVPAQTILVSPSDAPGVNGPLGLTGPVPLPETIVNTGGQVGVPAGVTVTITPVEEEPDLRDFILIFPADSGLKPLYVMLSSHYGKATDKGKYSGRSYNPDKAGGPVQELEWHNVVIDQTGIDKVKLHTSRFGKSEANKVMIDRLEKILSGQLQVTDTDKRFYTHEMRELDRYRTLGIPDNAEPDDKGVTWNNTHTATLEDYKINEKTDPLYTQEALEAEYKAELENISKGVL